MTENATIVLQRVSAWSSRLRKFKVELDGDLLGTIANDEQKRFTVASGHHVVQVKCDWNSSRKVSIDLSPGEALHLRCGAPVVSDLKGQLKGLVSPAESLELERIDPVEQRDFVASADGPRAKTKIFISYRRKDSPDVCGRIYDRLAQAFGKSAVFIDVDDIPLGVDFRQHLDQQVAQCEVLLAVIGDGWLEMGADGQNRLFDELDFVRLELESALARNIPVIPLLVRGAGLPGADQLPDSLKPLLFRHGLPIRPDPDFHNDMQRLIDGLRTKR